MFYAYYLPALRLVKGTQDPDIIAELVALYLKHHDVSQPIHPRDGASIQVYRIQTAGPFTGRLGKKVMLTIQNKVVIHTDTLL